MLKTRHNHYKFASIALSVTVLFLLCGPAYSNQDDKCYTDSISSKIHQFSNTNFEDALKKIELNLDTLLVKHDTVCIVKLYIKYINNTIGKSAIYHLVFDDLWDALLLADQAGLQKEKYLIYIDLARFFGYLKKYEKGEEYFGYASNLIKTIHLTPEDYIDYYKARAQFYNENGNQEKAKVYVDSCDQTMTKYNMPTSYFLEFRRGAILRDEGDHSSAIKIFKEVQENFNSTYPAVNSIVSQNLGYSYAQLGMHDKAIDFYKTAIKTINKYKSHLDHLPELHNLLAESYHKIGDNEKAYQESSKASKLKEVYGNTSTGLNNRLLQVKDDFKEYKIQEGIRTRKSELEKLNQDKNLLTLQRILLAGTVLFLGIIFIIYFYYQNQKLKREQVYNKILSSRNDKIKTLFEDLKKKNDNQVVFSNIMTHDLKAPLNTVYSFSSLIKKSLKQDSLDKSKITRFNDLIMGSSTSMLQLIEDLLIYFKVGVDEKKNTLVDLNVLIEETLESFSADIESKSLVKDIQQLPCIFGNKELLKSVFHNLVSNAIKYQPITKDGHIPKIKIYSKTNHNSNLIYIEDNGIGIADAFQANIFKSFSKYHNRSEYAGSGLGLFICKEVMLKHNGSIELECSEKNKTIFKLTFPIVKT